MIETLHSPPWMSLNARATASEPLPREYAKLTPLCLMLTMWLMINLRSFILSLPLKLQLMLNRARDKSAEHEKKLIGPGRSAGGFTGTDSLRRRAFRYS